MSALSIQTVSILVMTNDLQILKAILPSMNFGNIFVSPVSDLHPGENFRYEIAVYYGLCFQLQKIHIFFGDVFAGAYLINVFLESEIVNTDFMINSTNNTCQQVNATSMDSELCFWPIPTIGANYSLNCYMNVVYTNSTFKRCAQTSISCRRFSDINQIQCTRWSACSFPSCTYSCTLDKSFKMFPARQSTLYLTSIKANMYVSKLLKFHKEIFFFAPTS